MMLMLGGLKQEYSPWLKVEEDITGPTAFEIDLLRKTRISKGEGFCIIA